MHNILFDSYRKYQKKNKSNAVKLIFKLPLLAKILLGFACLCVIYSVLTIVVVSFRRLSVVCLLLEFVLCIWLYFYAENFRIKNSDSGFSKYQEYCSNISQWLIQIGVIVTRENLTELVSRLETEIERKEKQRVARRDNIFKFAQIIIIPVLLAVFSTIIREQADINNLWSCAINFLFAIVFFSLLFFLLYNGFDFFEKRKLEQLKSLSSDLQGVIDCQFDDKLFVRTN